MGRKMREREKEWVSKWGKTKMGGPVGARWMKNWYLYEWWARMWWMSCVPFFHGSVDRVDDGVWSGERFTVGSTPYQTTVKLIWVSSFPATRRRPSSLDGPRWRRRIATASSAVSLADPFCHRSLRPNRRSHRPFSWLIRYVNMSTSTVDKSSITNRPTKRPNVCRV